MKKRTVIIFASVILSLIAIVLLSNPLRRSAEKLKSEMFKKTPLGMEMNDVKKIARGMGGRISVSTNAGFNNQDDNSTVGVKSIRSDVGDYWAVPPIPFPTSVTYFWGFDENGKLIDIWVWKTTDAL